MLLLKTWKRAFGRNCVMVVKDEGLNGLTRIMKANGDKREKSAHYHIWRELSMIVLVDRKQCNAVKLMADEIGFAFSSCHSSSKPEEIRTRTSIPYYRQGKYFTNTGFRIAWRSLEFMHVGENREKSTSNNHHG